MGLGGGANLTREPRGGRSFEYLGEDPLLAGELLAERTKGTQSQKVMASIKHFAGNEQETNRMGGDSHIDDRSLRELYLLPFEIAVEQGHPASVMCSYNRLNGGYSCENSVLLNDILKTQWHFPGQVQSDWGATHTRQRRSTPVLMKKKEAMRAPLTSRVSQSYSRWQTMTSPKSGSTIWCAANSIQ